MFNDIANYSNHVDPDLKVTTAHAPLHRHCTSLDNRLNPVMKFGSLGNYLVAGLDS